MVVPFYYARISGTEGTGTSVPNRGLCAEANCVRIKITYIDERISGAET